MLENITFSYFAEQVVSHPALLIAVLLTLGVILVNGWTDAPNAIATCVSTRCIDVDKAIIMAAACNFLGVLIMSLVNSKVAMTIKNMVNFGGDTDSAMIALCAAMTAIVIWAIGAWAFGIPTSESHALIAGLTGAAIALQGGLDGVNPSEWIKVIYGLVLSTVLGFAVGFVVCKLLAVICYRFDRRKTIAFFSKAQVAGSAAVAFMHGAQDGQKFMSIFVLAITLATGVGQADQMVLPIWLMFFCALNMGIGTAVGGERIIKSVGLDMVKLEPFQGFAASAATFFCLILSTFAGLPVSTTHTNTTAIMGVGAAKRKSAVKWGIAVDMVKTWVLTFPGCGLLGFAFAHLFLFF